MKHATFLAALDRALAGTALELPAGARERLAEHWALVKAWSARVNLTAVTDDAEAALRHYRDSLEALPLLPDGSIVDFGSGAGFPGIPLAVAAPDRQLTLLEPRRKRASFLEVAASRLGLANVRVICGASTGEPDRAYAAGVTRATFSDAAELTACLAWLAPAAPLIAYRTEASGEPGTEIHPYVLGDSRRVLEIRRRPR